MHLPHLVKCPEEDDAADLGLDVKMIGRWHDLAAGTGTAIVESASVDAVYSWVVNWAPMISATTYSSIGR